MSKDASLSAAMPKDPTLSDVVKALERSLEDSERPPRTLADRLLAFGADFILAIAFFALSLTANVVASLAVESHASSHLVLMSALGGIIVLKLWSIVREYESARDELKNERRDVRLAALIVEQTVAALAKQQHASGGSSDGSGGSDSEAVPTSHTS